MFKIGLIRPVIVLLAICTFSPAYGQSTFFDKGESGYGILVGYSGAEDVNGFWATVGQSFKGVFDVGFEAGKYEDNWAYGGYASYYPIKGRTMAKPLAVAIDLSVGIMDQSRQTWQGSVDRKYTQLTAGLSLHHTLVTSPTSFIELMYGGSVAWLFDGSDGEKGQGVISVGVPLGFKMSASTNFLIAPSMLFAEDVTTFSIAVGFTGLSGRKIRDWED
ncbi:MAG: hypothetical protein ABIE70_06165 [bacterium]